MALPFIVSNVTRRGSGGGGFSFPFFLNPDDYTAAAALAGDNITTEVTLTEPQVLSAANVHAGLGPYSPSNCQSWWCDTQTGATPNQVQIFYDLGSDYTWAELNGGFRMCGWTYNTAQPYADGYIGVGGINASTWIGNSILAALRTIDGHQLRCYYGGAEGMDSNQSSGYLAVGANAQYWNQYRLQYTASTRTATLQAYNMSSETAWATAKSYTFTSGIDAITGIRYLFHRNPAYSTVYHGDAHCLGLWIGKLDDAWPSVKYPEST